MGRQASQEAFPDLYMGMPIQVGGTQEGDREIKGIVASVTYLSQMVGVVVELVDGMTIVMTNEGGELVVHFKDPEGGLNVPD